MDYFEINPEGKNVVVIGRSLVVGKPVAIMLIQKNATVTICHTKTTDMPAICREADILIVAAGRANIVGKDYFNKNQIVIDVGINVLENGKLCGDVNFEEAEPIVSAITPVPGGIGTVTTNVLVKHVIKAAQI
jgi:methylenetetrahydrofolate dehydrogenase (NADP+)/methenyltetrahydrofolate cyclohydrolase